MYINSIIIIISVRMEPVQSGLSHSFRQLSLPRGTGTWPKASLLDSNGPTTWIWNCNGYTYPYIYYNHIHIIPCHTIPCHTIPCHTIPYHTIPYHTIPKHTIPYHTIHYITLHYTTLHYITYIIIYILYIWYTLGVLNQLLWGVESKSLVFGWFVHFLARNFP